MPDQTFLETYPLYRKFATSFSPSTNIPSLPQPAIHMRCDVCSSDQTFTIVNKYESHNVGGSTTLASGSLNITTMAIYLCSSCRKFKRHFLLEFSRDGQYVIKVGQNPSYDITLEPHLEQILGKEHSYYYKKGKISESQGYGIGAFAYYRRIAEEIIDGLLEQIPELMAGVEKDKYLVALEEVKKTRQTKEKIELVKDLLPPILKPDNYNPLSLLHGLLSEGLHQSSEEECLERADELRSILEFLVKTTAVYKDDAKTFTDTMKKILDRKSKDSSGNESAST